MSFNNDKIPHSQPTLISKDLDGLKTIFKSRFISSGAKVEEFKKSFKKYLKKEYIELYSSGSQALYRLLLALNVNTGDDVLIPSYICDSVKRAVLNSGANLVFYDNKINSWISSSEEIMSVVTSKTKAIIVNHTFGMRYSYNEIKRISLLNIPLIEDCAHFVSQKEEDVGISNLFIASFYSFSATKLLTTGEGGAVCTNNNNLIRELESIKLDDGISDIGASLGLNQLNNLNNFLKRREDIANIYIEEFKLFEKNTSEYKSIFFRFPILHDNPSIFLNSEKVTYKKGVDKILANQKNSLRIFKKTVSIPIYPSLTNSQVDLIVNETKRLLHEN